MPSDQVPDSLHQNDGIPYSIETVSTEEALSSLEADWNRLSNAAKSPNIFVSFDWFCAWAKHVIHQEQPARIQPNILLLKKNRTVTGIVPLILRNVSRFGFHLRKLEFVTNHADYNDLVLGDDSESQTEAVVSFLAQSAAKWDVIDLRDLRDTGNTIAHIEGALVRAGLHYRLIPEDARCLYMPISGPWSETMKQKHLRFARRAYCSFEERSSEGFTVRVVDNPQLEAGLLERMIVVEAQKHVDGKLSLPVLGQYPEVFQALFNRLGPSGSVKVVLVEQRDRLVAWRLLYRCGDKLWDHLTAYDHSFSSLSPGTILICAAIDDGFANGLSEFDFLRGEESYKLRWTSKLRQNYRLLIWNRRWASRLRAAAYFKLRN
jgi:CelD/BcsL family acetyltransferase involved in cellulose biosynthesis